MMIRVLAVRQPWASLIIEGLKTIEVRSKPTNIRGKVAIYASTHLPSQKEFIDIRRELAYRLLDDHRYDPSDELPVGKIIGTVYIDSSSTQPVISKKVFNMYQNQHLANESYFNENGVHFWYLKYSKKFSQPIPYKPPKGAVVWSKTELPEGYK